MSFERRAEVLPARENPSLAVSALIEKLLALRSEEEPETDVATAYDEALAALENLEEVTKETEPKSVN